MKVKKKSKRAPNSMFHDLTLKALKQEVIARGLDFESVISFSVPELHNWLCSNFREDKVESRIAEYDDYIDAMLKDLGAEDLIYSSLRLSYVGDRSEDFSELEIKPKKTRIRGEKVVKEKTEQGIYSGTKKALTYQCLEEGKTVEETIEIVKSKFEDAADKSIKIWYRKAKKSKEAKG